MVTIIATVYGRKSTTAELKRALMELGRKTRREEGNVQFHMHERQDDPSTFIFYESYRDEHAFQAHLGSVHAKAFGDLFSQHSLGRAETEIIRLTPIEL